MTMVDEPREKWSSRSAFLLTAIGAAVGFGNVWRFPALAYDYGGGAFFLPYGFALVCIGIPFLIQEIAMGQHLQTSDVGVSNSINKHLRGVGLASVTCGFIVVTYYVPLISWCFRAFFESFGKMRNDWEDISGSDATLYFFHDVLGTNTLEEDNRPTRLIPLNVFYLALTWSIVGACISFGIQVTGRIAYVTMGLPVLMLFILLVRSLSLPGASSGISNYVGKWDWSILVEKPDVWSTAVSQIFFSIGVAFGVMTAFGSHCEKNAPAYENSLVIAISNSFFSVISGFCVFGILGYLSTIEGDFEMKSGPALLFGAYPAALSTITFGLQWVRFLFLNLILLGLDSAFALLEAVVSTIEDSTTGVSYPKHVIVAILCVFGFLVGLIYTTDAGLLFLDVVDFYINFILLLLGFFKSFSAGWIFKMEDQIILLGQRVVFVYVLCTFGSLLIASIVWFGIDGNTVVLGLVCLFVIYTLGMIYCRHQINLITDLAEEEQTSADLWYQLTMGNIMELKTELETSVGYIPKAWAVVMKHLIPQVLLVLFVNLSLAKTEKGNWELGSYGDYLVWPFQFIGLSEVLFVASIVIIGFVKADLFERLVKIESKSHNILTVEMETQYREMTTV